MKNEPRIPTEKQIQTYLSNLTSRKIEISYFGPLTEFGKRKSKEDVKKLGYGVPYLLAYKEKGKEKKSILSTMRIGRGFGHDYRSDRVDNLIMSYDTWNHLPNHCRVQDFGAFRKNDSGMISLGNADEFFILRPMVQGIEYYKDLDRILEEGKLEKYDIPKCKTLAEYLVTIHKKKNRREIDEGLYTRKIRDTLGHGECIFGLVDSYPHKDLGYVKPVDLERIEKKCVEHRWRLKDKTFRLSQVHGDFHPWNILFKDKTTTKFFLLDRSRGEWGEPADDVCALSINYIFYSLRKYGDLRKEFLDLYNEFIGLYLEGSGDKEILNAMPLFYVFRALVIASPLWYPTLTPDIRRKIFNFAENILDSNRFEPSSVNEYLKDAN